MVEVQQQQPAPASASSSRSVSSSSAASEERRRTGQYMALGVVLATSLVGLYHACLQHNAALAGFLVPAVIMMLYLVWVLHSTRGRHKHEGSASGVEAGMSPAAAKRLADHSLHQGQQGLLPPHNNNKQHHHEAETTASST